MQIGGTGDDRGAGIAVGPDGNVVVSGGLNGGNFVYAEGHNNQYGASEPFVTKFSSNGTQQWFNGVTGSLTKGSLNGLAIDAAGDVYAAGAFDGTANFGGAGSLSSGGPPTATCWSPSSTVRTVLGSGLSR